MKIAKVEAIPVWLRPSDEYHALFGSGKKKGTMVHARETWFANIKYKENVFVKITTDDGIVGWGEACAHPVTSETQAGHRRDGRALRPHHHGQGPVPDRRDPRRARPSVPAGQRRRAQRDRHRALRHHGQGLRAADLQPAGRRVPDERSASSRPCRAPSRSAWPSTRVALLKQRLHLLRAEDDRPPRIARRGRRPARGDRRGRARRPRS